MSTVDITRILDVVYGEAINKGNLDALDEVFGPDYVDHGVLGDFVGLEAFKGLLTQWRQAFPDVHSTWSDVVQDGDRAAWRSTMTGTHLGDLPGIPATGKQVRLETIDMGIARDNRAVEHRSIMDRLAMLEQLGLVARFRRGRRARLSRGCARFADCLCRTVARSHRAAEARQAIP